MLSFPQAPYALRDPEQVAARLKMRDLPHIQPLLQWLESRKESLTEQLQTPEVHLPLFDPLSGGIHTQVLLLLSDPGNRASAAKGSGFISCDNHDQTARNVFTALKESELPRGQVMCWNVVPWHKASQEPPTRAEVRIGVRELQDLLTLLPELKVVVLHGGMAQKGWTLLPEEVQARYRVFEVGHPSARNYNIRPQERAKQLQVYREVYFLTQYPWLEGTPDPL
ncbi:uracil-DNA glycosylase [Deinococcus cellulosilyticus]|uniref:Uracil-DNA glycosylase-like domain-containing protein n=1 Tax=Deinococcus cellulosilyticus (strain DSM 18568 / NBRC 106333 / KACC 11606 / 5516J-15) TaxID=1223518 RepID=A0A511NAC8_DEIC1|nr:uracil-DNA glycosylase [Deinococcus cellulosilyticus]GEM49782.1 hypothetical protein DC3_54170 [Deinococcus cellulosilyticus NBRC 106333 = KACC 11606]